MAGGLLGDISSWLTSGFGGGGSPGQAGGLGGLLGGLTGSTNPLYDIMAILSFINEGQLTQEQMGFIKNVLNQQSSSMGTAGNPNALSAFRTAETPAGMSTGTFASNMAALTPQGWSPTKYANTANQLTQKLSQPFDYNTLQPVQASLAAQGQATSPTTQQYVSEQALAPFNIQEQQMGQQGANALMQQQLADQQMGLTGAQDMMNQFLQEQNLGQNMTQFGLQLPFQANPQYPSFNVQDPNSMNSLLSTLFGGSGGGNLDLNSLLSMFGGSGSTGGSFNLSNLSSLLGNQFLPGSFP